MAQSPIFSDGISSGWIPLSLKALASPGYEARRRPPGGGNRAGWSPLVLATLTSSLGGALAILRKVTSTALLRPATALLLMATVAMFTALAAGLGRQLAILREAPLLARHALASLTGDVTLLVVVHRCKSAILCHSLSPLIDVMRPSHHAESRDAGGARS